ncbi:MAG: peroxidase-related enzyme [Terracidiphilus sp.]
MRLFVAKLLESIPVFSRRPQAIHVEAPALPAQITSIIVAGWQRQPRQYPGKSTGEQIGNDFTFSADGLHVFATHLVLLRHMTGLAENKLFVDGFLSRRHKEMIATLASLENTCPYCADSHGYSLRNLGRSAEQITAIEARNLNSPAFSLQEQSLLAFVDKITRESHLIHRDDIAKLIEAGWSESQIAEAIHVAALFATFNRIVNAFGLPSQHLLNLYKSRDVEARIESANSSKSSE